MFSALVHSCVSEFAALYYTYIIHVHLSLCGFFLQALEETVLRLQKQTGGERADKFK